MAPSLTENPGRRHYLLVGSAPVSAGLTDQRAIPRIPVSAILPQPLLTSHPSYEGGMMLRDDKHPEKYGVQF